MLVTVQFSHFLDTACNTHRQTNDTHRSCGFRSHVLDASFLFSRSELLAVDAGGVLQRTDDRVRQHELFVVRRIVLAHRPVFQFAVRAHATFQRLVGVVGVELDAHLRECSRLLLFVQSVNPVTLNRKHRIRQQANRHVAFRRRTEVKQLEEIFEVSIIVTARRHAIKTTAHISIPLKGSNSLYRFLRCHVRIHQRDLFCAKGLFHIKSYTPHTKWIDGLSHLGDP